MVSSGKYLRQTNRGGADSWYSNQIMQTFIKQTVMNFRLDTQSNLNAQCPDHQAIINRRKRLQGRKCHKFDCYVPLKEFIGNSHQWHYFIDRTSGARVYYNKVIATLKTVGRVTIYAFQRELLTRPKFILTWVFRLQPVDPRTVYSQYQARWRIEEAHRDLKQQFGLSKCQARHAWVVWGFIDLVYLGSSIWKLKRWLQVQLETEFLKYPSWVNSFHQYQIRQGVFTGS